MNAMTEAREHAINTHNPVIVHANCVRIGSHSNSDKQTLYRDENELAYAEKQPICCKNSAVCCSVTTA